MKRGAQGGIEAAQNLRSYVIDSLSQKAVNLARDLGVMIYIYADTQRLAANYAEPNSPRSVGLLQAQDLVREFRRGFNSAHPRSCYDDVTVSTSKKYQLRGE